MNRKISVIGRGYVGLPVAVAFGKRTKSLASISANAVSLNSEKDVTPHVR